MKKYTYIGLEHLAFSLADGSEFILHNGCEYELPSDNNYIKVLVAYKLIIEVKQTKEKTK